MLFSSGLFRNRFLVALAVLVLMFVFGLSVGAEEAEAVAEEVIAGDYVDIAAALDVVWVLVAAFLVFLMHAGFAMVETGFTRAKNAGNILMKNFMTFSGGSIAYWILGFAIMFGTSTMGLIGFGGLALGGDWSDFDPGVPLYVFAFFQSVFAATAATIVSGAVAERIKFSSYLIFSVIITAFIYPVVGHWVWGGGWLEGLGFIDFAGSTVVHTTGGIGALIGAAMLGARHGKYGPNGKVNAIPGHNITMGALGVFILWFGWFGFNGGSTISGSDAGLGMIIFNTNLGASAGAIMAMVITWLKYKKPDVSMTLNGGLAGLVSITAGAADISPVGALIMGGIGGVIVAFSIEIIDRKFRVDDPVGAVSVHGTCGILGTVLVGLFALDGGLFYGGGATLLGTQFLGSMAVVAWVAVVSAIVFGAIKATLGLRVSREHEIRGLDYEEHGMETYADFVPR